MKKMWVLLLAALPLFAWGGQAGPGVKADANTVTAGPTSGAAALPTYRTLIGLDLAQAVTIKLPVRLATTVSGTLATSFENGDTLDSTTLATNDRILIKNQASAAENGLYTVNASGAPTRATDADAAAELQVGLIVTVKNGTINSGKLFVMTAASDPITVNTTALTFTEISGGGASDGDKGDITISLTGTAYTIDATAVTFAKFQNIATDRLLGRDTASSGSVEELTVGGGIEFTGSAGIQRSALTGDVTATAGSNATTIATDAVTTTKILADAVTNAKLADATALSVKANATNASDNPTDLAAASDYQVLRRSGTALAFGAVNLAQAAAVTGALPPANGGTGLATITSGALMTGNGTGNVVPVGPGTTGQIPISNGTTIAMTTVGTDATITSAGALTIANNAITTAKMTDANVTLAKLESRARPTENLLVNGEFGFQQRGLSGTVWGTGSTGVNSGSNQGLGYEFGPDHWWCLGEDFIGTGLKVRREDAPSEGARWSLEVTPTINRYGFLQVVSSDQSIAMRGRTVIFQSRLKRDSSSANWRVAIFNWTGTADTIGSNKNVVNALNDWTVGTFTEGNFFATNANYDIAGVSSAVSVGTSYTTLSYSVSVSSSCNNIMVFMWQDASSSTLTNITKVGLYDGDVARDWLPRSFQEELELCQGFYEKCYDLDVAPNTSGEPNGQAYVAIGTAASAEFGIPVSFRVTKVGAPTITLYDGAGNSGKISYFAAGVSNNQVGNIYKVGHNGFSVYTDSGTSKRGFFFYWTAESEY